MKPNVNVYVQKINDLVQTTENTGEAMNPFYEEIRTGIDEGKLSELSSERLTEIKAEFQKGVDQYKVICEELARMKPTAKIMGVHKKMEKAYQSYYSSCKSMVDAIDAAKGDVDVTAFNQSDECQDAATDTISFCIHRITQLVAGR